ncbi:hypothetical protein MPTK1_3g17360 [Marchantia polymorpha subsp. ruderalis]|uniref:Uncharacterized protein n=2 Tax=Marchantia polymorpha TaxID=3197 RepID=A0AAF6B1T7_MARPO|nr:hypothetical protein MARPO_0039s0058 [Marchantia polymorpha]BBN05971.1 hypothetical protein Mp_3g17360 [Marchantia polymorpha subsp. ruderalis]|eukprot:PTQ40553.1 hypothetical protein MARPO_0039s0058 [Marchantia polymorpha]
MNQHWASNGPVLSRICRTVYMTILAATGSSSGTREPSSPCDVRPRKYHSSSKLFPMAVMMRTLRIDSTAPCILVPRCLSFHPSLSLSLSLPLSLSRS